MYPGSFSGIWQQSHYKSTEGNAYLDCSGSNKKMVRRKGVKGEYWKMSTSRGRAATRQVTLGFCMDWGFYPSKISDIKEF